jgi:hypothetical protein
MADNKFVPLTPSGTVIHWLARKTEADAWAALLEDAVHMPYRGIAGFKSRGYRVVELTAAQLKRRSTFPQAMSKPLGEST